MPGNAAASGKPTLWMPTRSRLQRCLCPWKSFAARLNDGTRRAVRILTTARGAMSADRTRSVNALNALVRSNNLGVDARKSLTASQTSDISRWRSREEELSLSVAGPRLFAWQNTSSIWTTSSWPTRSGWTN